MTETQDGKLAFGMVGVQASFTRQGSLRVDAGWGREPWAGREFPTRRVQAFGGAQLLRWLNVNFYANRGRSIYYDTESPFVGDSWSHSFGLTVQPGASFSQNVSWDRYQLHRPGGGERVVGVDLLNLRTTYQFDRRFALRGILRYDSGERRVLTDVLASFEPVPGTVAYAGYGSLDRAARLGRLGLATWRRLPHDAPRAVLQGLVREAVLKLRERRPDRAAATTPGSWHDPIMGGAPRESRCTRPIRGSPRACWSPSG